MISFLCLLGLAGSVLAQDPLPEKPATLVLRDASWFVGTPATAVIALPEEVETPEDLPDGGDGVAILSVEVEPSANSDGSVALVRWLPRRPGLVVFPELTFASGKTTYRTPARQIQIGSPERSAEMTLSLTPEKTRVYTGEPLRIEVVWTCGIPARRLREMRSNPAFFNDPAVESVIPRTTAPEKEQLGLPFGGRRVIARRAAQENEADLGTVRFPLFLRFNEVGRKVISAVRIECVRLKEDSGALAPYASYFNNGLFEPVPEGAAHDRIFVESAPFDIEVLALPAEGRSASFSGLFLPCSIEAAVKPAETEVGGLLEINLSVRSNAPHGFLELSNLGHQRALRSWFKVDPEYGRIWDPEGTIFRTRVRPLTTQVKALPALAFQAFDPESGNYIILETEAVPLKVSPHDGMKYFDAKSLAGENPGLTDQPQGNWQNEMITPMDAILNTMVNFLAEWFWLLILAGPLVAALSLPVVRESRRRALDADYRRRQDAYRAFLRIPDGTLEKQDALRKFLATSFGVDPAAWTAGDTRRLLAERGVAPEDIDQVARTEEQHDAATFSPTPSPAKIPHLGATAKRIAAILNRCALIALALILIDHATASEWDDGQASFDQALIAEPSSPAAVTLFTKSALSFEEAASNYQFPGRSWENAGNAWFQAGEIGRAIACYRQAEVYRPFDSSVRENLRAARALALDVVKDTRPSWLPQPPVRWLLAGIIPLWFAFLATLLIHIRYDSRRWLLLARVLLVIVTLVAAFTLWIWAQVGKEGVIVASEVFGRKGPSFRYQTAFSEALHDGLEVSVVESRDPWLKIQLADGRQSWVPDSGVRRITR